ncbi:MAG TPA: ATP-dependent endonuclease [Chloroflexota bacterium]|nr:ATP-dependent endonuclease [Chloroflexota bacterium]
MDAARRPTLTTGDARAVLLVEGVSDQIAMETAATRLGRNLEREGVTIVPIGGAHALGRVLNLLHAEGKNMRLAGIYDIGEEHVVRRALQRAGLADCSPLTRAGMEDLGFYACAVDLEDELIRSLGADAMRAIIEAQGELAAFHTLQKEPAWRGQPVENQLRRWLGSGGTRKIRYARLVVEALDPARVPQPLREALGRL